MCIQHIFCVHLGMCSQRIFFVHLGMSIHNIFDLVEYWNQEIKTLEKEKKKREITELVNQKDLWNKKLASEYRGQPLECRLTCML